MFADDAADDADDDTDDDAVNTKIPIMDTISPTIIDIQHSLRMSSQRLFFCRVLTVTMIMIRLGCCLLTVPCLSLYMMW